MKNKFYSIGEVLIDFLPMQKDDVDNTFFYKQFIGGAPANVAVSIARLGEISYFIGKVGEDIFGKYILDNLSKYNVDTSYLTFIKKNTALAFVSLNEKGDRDFAFYRDNCADANLSKQDVEQIKFNKDDILHFGSISMIEETSREATEFAIKLAKQNNTLISYDPNLRPRLWDSIDNMIETAKKYIKYANIIKFSVEEVETLFGDFTDEIINQLLNNVTKLILVTDGERGSYLYTKDYKLFTKSYKVNCIDATGAGDAFIAGILYKILSSTQSFDNILNNQQCLKEYMSFANCNAGLTTTKKGVFSALPTLLDINNFIKQQADEILEQNAIQAYNSIYRPNYHIYSQSGWINDPNGLVKFKNEYHVFYQLHPFSPEWGPMHWGHVVSNDLVHFKRLQTALTPDISFESGCFSGSAVENNDELVLFYTSNNPDRNPKEYQCIAKSKDGINFIKEKTPIIQQAPNECSEDFRDPKVWKYKDLWYMIVGSGKYGKAKIPIYTSKNLETWDYRGILITSDENQGNMWECPNYACVEGQDILIVSPMNMKNHKSIFIYGSLDYENFTFNQTHYEEIDFGEDFYAPQIFYNDENRTILIGWMEMWGNEMPTQKDGFAGILTFPRELTLCNNQIVQNPIDEIKLLYKKTLMQDESFIVKENTTNNLSKIYGKSLDLSFTIEPINNTKSFWFNLCCSEDRKEKTVLTFDIESNQIIVDRSLSGEGNKKKTITKYNFSKIISVRLLIDNSSIEIFIDNGKKVISNRIYSNVKSIYYDLITTGTLNISKCNAYILESIW